MVFRKKTKKTLYFHKIPLKNNPIKTAMEQRPLYAAILADLHRRYETSTYQAISKATKVAYTYLRALMLGERPVGHLSLDYFFRLFPSASVSLYGNPPAPGITQTATAASRARITQTASPSGDLAAFKGRLALALSSLDIPGEALAAVLRTVARTE